jgi:hypothetical protein
MVWAWQRVSLLRKVYVKAKRTARLFVELGGPF